MDNYFQTLNNINVNDKAEKIGSGEIVVTNAQNGDEFDPASCPLVVVKSN